MKARRAEPEQPRRAVARPWDNTGLRHRVEGKEIEGVDVLALQSSVVARDDRSPRRRHRRSR